MRIRSAKLAPAAIGGTGAVPLASGAAMRKLDASVVVRGQRIEWRTATHRTALARVAVAAALALWAGTAGGEWKALGTAAPDSPRIAYDTERIRFEPPHVTAWTRVQLPATATLANGVRYRSVLQKVAVDCAARTWEVTHSDFYGNADAAGEPVYSDTRAREEWVLHPARAGSTGDLLIRALCTTPRPW